MSFVVYSRTKQVIYFLMSSNHLIYNRYFWDIIENKETVCSTPRMTVIFGYRICNNSPASWTFEAPSNMITSIIDLWGLILLKWSRNLLHIKVAFFVPPSAKCPWQSTSSNTVTGRFFPETKMFNRGTLEFVAPYPRNDNPKLSDSFSIRLNFFSCSDHV